MASKEIVVFAKRLASNEKKIRDRSIKRLNFWLSKRSKEIDFDEIEMLKLWRGLFYCMWMSDKSLIQEELADSLASLLLCFEDAEKWSLFLSSFYNTMSREWIGIDRLRMDKFYMLMKKMMKQSLAILSMREWDDTWINVLVNVLSEGPIHPSQFKVLDGIRLYLTEIFLSVLLSLDISKVSSQNLVCLLKPFITLSAESSNKVVLSNTDENIYQQLLDEDIKSKIPSHKELYSVLEKFLFDLGSKGSIKPRNRKVLYEASKKFRQATVGHNDALNATEPIPEESLDEDVIAQNDPDCTQKIDEDVQADDTTHDSTTGKRKKKKKEKTGNLKNKRIKKAITNGVDDQKKPEILHQQNDQAEAVIIPKKSSKVSKTNSKSIVTKAKSLIKFKKTKKPPTGTVFRLSSKKQKELEEKGQLQTKKSKSPTSSAKKVRIMLKKNKTQEFHKDEPAINVSPFRTNPLQIRSKAENFF